MYLRTYPTQNTQHCHPTSLSQQLSFVTKGRVGSVQFRNSVGHFSQDFTEQGVGFAFSSYAKYRCDSLRTKLLPCAELDSEDQGDTAASQSAPVALLLKIDAAKEALSPGPAARRFEAVLKICTFSH